jgi:hypothetical protein
MMIDTGWRVENRLEEVEKKIRKLDLLRRAHSVAIDLDGMPMTDVLAIALRVKGAETELNVAVREFGAMAARHDQERAECEGKSRSAVSAPGR